MKRTIFFLFVCLAFISCSKNSQKNVSLAQTKTSLVGNWQLSAMYIQTSGPGSWHVHDSIPPDYLQLNADGTLTMTAYVSYLYNDPIGYQVTSDTTIQLNYPFRGDHIENESVIYYKLTDTVLTITPPSIEYVVEKYVKTRQSAP